MRSGGKVPDDNGSILSANSDKNAIISGKGETSNGPNMTMASSARTRALCTGVVSEPEDASGVPGGEQGCRARAAHGGEVNAAFAIGIA